MYQKSGNDKAYLQPQTRMSKPRSKDIKDTLVSASASAGLFLYNTPPLGPTSIPAQLESDDDGGQGGLESAL
jgi:hypothetical protein